jgi:D-tyrosyl-tRNA(Tyr) deacylase
VRAVVQRVRSASVDVDGRAVAEIGPGLLILLGVGAGDDEATADACAAKLSRLRLFEDADGRMGESLGERQILCVSQFTLYGDVTRGNRPSFTAAAEPGVAKRLYERVCDALGAERGVFGARMAVESVNDGPVTLIVETTPANSV